MKKLIFAATVLIMSTFCMSGKTVMLDLSINSLSTGGNQINTDFGTGYESAVRSGKIYSELKFSLAVYRNVYVWGSYGMGPVKSKFYSSMESNTNPRKILSGGLGLWIGYFEPGEFVFTAQLGLANVRYTIENDTRSYEFKSTGLRFDVGVNYMFTKDFYAMLNIGNIWCKKTFPGESDGSKLGGFRIGVGIGAAF